MNVHGIINGILVFVFALIFIAQVIKKLGGSGAAAPTPAPAPAPGAALPARSATQPSPAAKTPALVPRRRLAMPGPEAFAPAPRHPERVEGQPQPRAIEAAPRQARGDTGGRGDMGAADVFPGLDLTLPDAAAPGEAVVVQPRRAGRTFRGNVMPGERGWGANAIVALEILGPPVSLRSGATLGAPHAF